MRLCASASIKTKAEFIFFSNLSHNQHHVSFSSSIVVSSSSFYTPNHNFLGISSFFFSSDSLLFSR
ncbi:unnamed protein product [Arabidopsis halleri]